MYEHINDDLAFRRRDVPKEFFCTVDNFVVE